LLSSLASLSNLDDDDDDDDGRGADDGLTVFFILLRLYIIYILLIKDQIGIIKKRHFDLLAILATLIIYIHIV
jgi:hypothetical protein